LFSDVEISPIWYPQRVKHDWDHSHRIDLSDQAIVKEMESHGRRDYGSLALEPEVKTTDMDDRKPNHKKGR